MNTLVHLDNNVTNQQYNLNGLIRNTLLSLDAIIFHFMNLYNTDITLYSLLNFYNNFTLNNLVSLIKSIIPHNINFNVLKNYNNYYILYFTDITNNNIVLIVHLFTMSLINFMNYSVESYYDINNIINNYYGFTIMPNYHLNNSIILTYDNLIQRIYNKKFSYISPDMDEVYDHIKNKNCKLTLPISTIINKINYAYKLILIGWIMDENVQKSWTINYYNSYKKFLNLIKFKNVKCVAKECEYCNKKLKLDDVIFNSKEYYMHYKCLFSYLYQE